MEIKEIKEMENNLNEIIKEYKEDVKFIYQSINEDSEYGRLSLHLLKTKRTSESIIEGGFDRINASCFSSMLHSLHHSLYDDGEITLYTVNNEPKISFKYDFTIKDCLSKEEKKLRKKFDCKILKDNIDNWIDLSNKYYISELKSNFLFDYELNPDLLESYKKNEDFDIKWLEELKK